MSELAWLKERFAAAEHMPALVWRGDSYSYRWLLDAMSEWEARLLRDSVGQTDIVSLTADFSPHAIAALLALIDVRSTIVPLTRESVTQDECREIAQVTVDVTVDAGDGASVRRFERVPLHPLYEELWGLNHPGLILFSSGSSGKSKAVLHDCHRVLEKFKTVRRAQRTIAFLGFDHIGGVNTLLHVISNGGTVVTVADRSPAAVCAAIEQHAVQVLPTSPTFLNVLLLSGATERFDLSSLETITYGTEVMPEGTLARLRAAFPRATLLQTYGLSEVGILRSRSESSDSLWVRVGGEGVATRVVDGMLQIQSASAMLGYLNAPSPFTEDGWFKTGDLVEQRDGFYRILGRQSDVINVGGEKVLPAEVEDVLQGVDGVVDVVVYGEPNAIVGHIVVAKVNLTTGETAAQFRTRMVQHCRPRLQPFQMPQRVLVSTEPLHGERYKRVRSGV